MTERERQMMIDEAQVYCRGAARPIERGDWEAACVALLAALKKADMALQRLTPGGSEYVGDPDRCVARALEIREFYRDLALRRKAE